MMMMMMMMMIDDDHDDHDHDHDHDNDDDDDVEVIAVEMPVVPVRDTIKRESCSGCSIDDTVTTVVGKGQNGLAHFASVTLFLDEHDADISPLSDSDDAGSAINLDVSAEGLEESRYNWKLSDTHRTA